MATGFASQDDLADKQVTFATLGDGLYAYTAEGDPNTGIIVGDDAVMVVDAQATPALARQVIAHVRQVTDKPIRHVVLTHYHAVRVLGASAYAAQQVLASRATYELIAERGQQDFESEVNRFPRLFRGVDEVPGLTWPTLAFEQALTVWLGKREVRLMHMGRGHTKGDIVAWLPQERVLFGGDLVECGATPYCGDAYLRAWPRTLDALSALRPRALVPGRGDALTGPGAVADAVAGTRGFVDRLYDTVAGEAARGADLRAAFAATHDALQPAYGGWAIFEHCMPFNVARAYDEATGHDDPRIWTKARDLDMWAALRG